MQNSFDYLRMQNHPKKSRNVVFCVCETKDPISKTDSRTRNMGPMSWGRHCDKLVFASTLTDVILNVIGFNLPDVHSFMWGREKLMLQYVSKNFGHKYDWFYKADDDTFAKMENLRLLLLSYSTVDSIYIGYKFNTTQYRWRYISGGCR